MKHIRKINKIIVHCSDSPDDKDLGFSEINEWHKQRGFKSPTNIHCGYHFIIRRDGTIEYGRPESEAGAHTQGQNSQSIGICWVGRNNISNGQWEALIMLCGALCQKYRLPYFVVRGHKEYNQEKTCPNLEMDDVRRDVMNFVGQKISGVGNGNGDMA